MRISRLVPTVTVVVALAGVGCTDIASAAVTHTVRRGETLTSVAAADGLSIGALAAANGISPEGQLVAGAQLRIPPRGSSVAAQTPSTAAPAHSADRYVVRRGDTLSAIAARYGVAVPALAAANGMSEADVLLAGRTLTISGGSAAPSSTVTTTTPAGATPTQETVAPSDVGSIASQSGVSPAFAEAIADQESGFNNAMVSSTGATGVMQIEPGTWADLSRIDGLTLSRSSAADNIRGGVSILHSLLDATGGDESQAAAAYYQGLQSVRDHGMYRSTRQYVRDVLALEGRFGG